MEEPKKLTSVELVKPELRAWWAALVPAWNETYPDLELRINESFRTTARQLWLYAKGRTEPGPVVTWRTHSNHEDGEALDIYIYRYGEWISGASADELNLYHQLAQLGERLGEGKIRNLGIHTGKDWYHFELVH